MRTCKRKCLYTLVCYVLVAQAARASQQEGRLLGPLDNATVEHAGLSIGNTSTPPLTFLPLHDPMQATADQAGRLYRQASGSASIAELLFAAAHPLSKLQGSTSALLPYLTPTVLRLYLSQPAKCATGLAAELYDIAQQLHPYTSGHARTQYALYRAVQDTFSWAAGHVPTRVQHVPDLPWADVAWPEADGLGSAVQAAMSDPDQLGGVGEGVEVATGGRLSRAAFAALVPRVCEVLAALHLDLGSLVDVGQLLQKAHWEPSAQAAHILSARSRHRQLWQQQAQQLGSGPAGSTVSHAHRRRLSQQIPPNFNYSMPPGGFVPRPPSELPQLLVPLVFHVMSYVDRTGAVGPVGYDNPEPIQRWVRLANIMSKQTRIQFFVQEIRSDARLYPYLRFGNRQSWLACASANPQSTQCLNSDAFTYRTVADYPRAVNVYVVGESAVTRALGYAFVPGSDVYPRAGHVFMAWDTVLAGQNSRGAYETGAVTLTHELFHHLGLDHTFGSNPDGQGDSCNDDDRVSDTPVALGSARSSSFYTTAFYYCLELFWGRFNGDWNTIYRRWSSNLGIPVDDMNAWADSCPNNRGYDELGNWMTYSSGACYAALGHFTLGQAQLAHYMTSEFNPTLYAWGQYYAQTRPLPDTDAAPVDPAEPAGYDPCTYAGQCRCKANWTTADGRSGRFCDTWPNESRLACEVEDPASCAYCTTGGRPRPCYLTCTGTPWLCQRTAGISVPAAPPPPPRLPMTPPAPPPPPPPSDTAIPPECMVSVTGCPCRSSWQFGSSEARFCDLPGSAAGGIFSLFCAVEPDCPAFDAANPWQYCDRSLTLSYCRGLALPSTDPERPEPPNECKVASATCSCLNNWVAGPFRGHYCDSPDGYPRLWCRADPRQCAGYNASTPFVYCDERLTLERCHGGGAFDDGGGSGSGHGGYGGYYGGYGGHGYGGYGGYGGVARGRFGGGGVGGGTWQPRA